METQNQEPNVCPRCGRVIEARATICPECNVNVNTGRDVNLPPERKRRGCGCGTALLLVLLVLIGLAGVAYWQIDRVLERLRTASADGAAPSLIEKGLLILQGDKAHELFEQARLSPEQIRRITQPPVEARPDRYTPPRQPGTRTAPGEAESSARHRAPAPVGRRDVLETLTCPCCDGTGRLDRPDSEHSTYRCPVCFGRGTRTVRRDPDEHLCAHCNGMGRTGEKDDFFRTHNRIRAERCPECHGTGVVRE